MFACWQLLKANWFWWVLFQLVVSTMNGLAQLLHTEWRLTCSWKLVIATLKETIPPFKVCESLRTHQSIYASKPTIVLRPYGARLLCLLWTFFNLQNDLTDQEIGDFMVLRSAGFPVTKLLCWNFLASLTCLGGVGDPIQGRFKWAKWGCGKHHGEVRITVRWGMPSCVV